MDKELEELLKEKTKKELEIIENRKKSAKATLGILAVLGVFLIVLLVAVWIWSVSY